MVGGSCVVRGNTFLRNSTEEGDGGGIYISRTPRSVFSDNVFFDNESGDHGGAIYIGNDGNGRVPAADIQVKGNLVLFNRSSVRIAPDCAGGGIYLWGGAVITGNTIAFNSAENHYPPAGGGICLVNALPGTVIDQNLIYRNRGGGVVTFKYSGPTATAELRWNLIFGNGRTEISNIHEPRFILTLHENLFVEPMFCIRGPGSRGELAAVSPALHQDYGIIGAVAEPGCGTEIQTNVQSTTWGAIKARYGPLSSESPGEERREK
jgi:putative cofactor-binding repeat protein/predicted outer membrane repeat protein